MTIKERAKEWYPKGVGVFTSEGAELLQKAYIRGATEQKAIDVSKVKRLVSVMLDKIEQFGINGDKEMWLGNFSKAIEQ